MKPIFLPPPAAAWNVGAAPAPLLVRTCVSVPAATAAITPDAFQVISSPSVPSASFAMPMALSAIDVAFPLDVTTPVRFALVVTFPAVRLDAVPDTLVITPDAGVPKAGVVRVGAVSVLFVMVWVAVSVTCAQAGMLLVPVLVKTLVEEVDLAKRLGVLAAEQYRISPRVVRMAGAVRSIFDFTWALSRAAVTTSPVTHVRGVVQAITYSIMIIIY